MSTTEDVLALLPAAGHARRLPALGASKEVLPVATDPATGRARLACEDLLAALVEAEIGAALLLTRREKLDVPLAIAALGLPLALATLIVGETRSAVHTLDAAWPVSRGRRIALGFPDVLLEPRSAFAELLAAQESTRAEVVLGLFPAAEPERSDQVELDAGGRVRRIAVKEARARSPWTWMAAVWAPAFTEYLHAALRHDVATSRSPIGDHWVTQWLLFGDQQWNEAAELQVGHVVQAALLNGMRIDAVTFPNGRALDIGTPEALARARSAHPR